LSRVIDWLADRLGYVPLTTAAQWVERERTNVRAVKLDLVGARIAVTKAEKALRDALSQRDLLQGFLNRANQRLEEAGQISVVTFI